MDYMQLRPFAEREDAERLEAELGECVPGGFSIDDPEDFTALSHKEHSYDWDYVADSVKPEREDRVVFTVWFEDTPDGMEKLDRVLSDAAYCGVTEADVTNCSDGDWIDRWKAYFKPKKIGQTIVVKPTWEAYAPEADEKVIEIDPGRAFGTGTHETTRLCVRALETYIPRVAEEKGTPLSAVTVLDVGCGSGILSLAAALLTGLDQSAKTPENPTILGIELDPVAVEVSKENVERNGLADAIRIMEGDLTKSLPETEKYAIVVANLMADLVIMLSKDVMKHILPGGYYISSGILVEKEPLVRAAIESEGFTVIETKIDGEWCAIVAKSSEEGTK